MANRSKKAVAGSKTKAARSLAIAQAGITTSNDFARLMSAVMSDLIEGSLNPVVGNAVCNAGAKLLKVVEMQYRYGNGDSNKTILLAPPLEQGKLNGETVQ